jgi:hypothetical protein
MDGILISGAVFGLTLGIVFGWMMNEPGLIGGGWAARSG